MEILTDLSAGMVPHRDWALRNWYSAGGRYYHGPRLAPQPPPGRNFYERVDPDLRELCRFVHERGLQTTPSCQGHFHPPRHFRKSWDRLQEERIAIRGQGLEVHDAEADRAYLFRNPHYEVPWDDWKPFCRQAASDQCIGYLGLLIEPRRADAIDDLQQLSGSRGRGWSMGFDREQRRVFGHLLFHIDVHTSGPRKQSRAWAEALQRLQEAMRAPAAHPAHPAHAAHPGAPDFPGQLDSAGRMLTTR